MPFAIEMFFEPACESRLRRLCSLLREGEHGNTVIINDVKARPHITLACYDEVDERALLATMSVFARKNTALPVALASVGMFLGSENVLFLAPAASEELTVTQRKWTEEAEVFSSTPWPLYAPGRWVPHCTLAIRVPREGILSMLGTLMDATLPISGELVELGACEFKDGKVLRYLDSYALG